MKHVLLALMFAVPSMAFAQDHTAHSAHAGKQTREIKALSPEEMTSLLTGAGAGYALAAELNHYPGPKHALELRDQLSLTAQQTARIERIYADMNAAAVRIGKDIVQAERDLDAAFASRTITPARLEKLVVRIGELNAALRTVHLGAHITTTGLLSNEQMHQYDVERGYQEHHE